MSHAAVIGMLVIYLAARTTNLIGGRVVGGIILATIFMSVIVFKLISLTADHNVQMLLIPLMIATVLEVSYFVIVSWLFTIYNDDFEAAALDYYYRAISKYFVIVPILTVPAYFIYLWKGTF